MFIALATFGMAFGAFAFVVALVVMQITFGVVLSLWLMPAMIMLFTCIAPIAGAFAQLRLEKLDRG